MQYGALGSRALAPSGYAAVSRGYYPVSQVTDGYYLGASAQQGGASAWVGDLALPYSRSYSVKQGYSFSLDGNFGYVTTYGSTRAYDIYSAEASFGSQTELHVATYSRYDKLRVTQDHHLSVDNLYMVTTVVLENIGTAAITNVQYSTTS